MLSDDESKALREIERRLRLHSPELVRLFDSQKPQPGAYRRQRARVRALLAAAAIKGLVLLGPQMLTEAEVRTQRRQPLPRTALADRASAGPAEPVSGTPASAGPVEVVDMLGVPPTIVAPPSRYSTCADEIPGPLHRAGARAPKSLSRKE